MRTNALHHELKDACQGHQCPLCHVINHSLKTQITHLLYESVNDGILRRRYIEREGFCQRHAHMMRSVGDPLAHAVLYGHLLKERLKEWQKPRPKPAKKGCVLCERQDEITEIVLLAFSNSLGDVDFFSAYEQSGIVCQEHFVAVLARMQKSSRDAGAGFKRVTLDKYGLMLHHLQELARKHDYRFAEEIRTEHEKKAWQEIVDLLAKKT